MRDDACCDSGPLEMTRGDNAQFQVYVTKNGAPVNLAGWTLTFTAVANRLYEFTASTSGGQVVVTGPGTAVLTLPQAATNALPNEELAFKYAWVGVDGAGNQTTLTKPPGDLVVLPNLSTTAA